MHKKAFIFFIFTCIAYCSKAQIAETQGWFFLSHTQKISQKFDVLADIQLRSANQFDYLSTILLRSALSYNFDHKHAVAVGYAYKGDWEHENTGTNYTLENRLYEQYLFQFKTGKNEWILRSRLEQRFIKDENIKFSQRARAFVSIQIPLIANSDFTKGVYTSLQDEIFLNVTNIDNVNRNVFDQNRVQGAIGYRWSKKIDTDLGYYFWYQKEMDTNYRRNVIQVMITSSF